MVKSAFLRKLDEWRDIFPERRRVSWNAGRIENEYCKDCRLCCGPQGDDDPYPMALLDEQLVGDISEDFYMLDPRTASLGREGCKSLGSGGCRLPPTRRPPACGLFPIALIDGRLYLYKRCPAAIFARPQEIASLAASAEKYLKNMPEASARRVSISIPEKELAEKYADLGIEIFSEADAI